jgi:hypothetical protein
MNRRKWLFFAVALALMGGGACLLVELQAHQRLGAPGVKTHPQPGSIRLQAELPETVLNFTSKWIDPDEMTLGTLPQDTSFGQRLYQTPDGFQVGLNVVLMGTDRTSLHKPQFCLEGQGLRIDPSQSLETKVRVDEPCSYDLPVVRLVADGEMKQADGQQVRARAVYVYWYVADDALSATISGLERMGLSAKRLLTSGVLQRWAYISCLSFCSPGQEAQTFERMKQFIAAAVPEFQLFPPAAGARLSTAATTPATAAAQ